MGPGYKSKIHWVFITYCIAWTCHVAHAVPLSYPPKYTHETHPKRPLVLSALMDKSKPNLPKGLATLIQDALQHNPDIREAHDRWLAESDVIPQSRTLPDPRLSAGYVKLRDTTDPFADPLEGLINLGVEQEITFPGKLYERHKIAKINASQSYEEYRAITLSIITDIMRKYYQLYLNKKTTEIVQKNLEILQRIEEEVVEKAQKTSVPEPDFLRAETEISRHIVRLVRLKQEYKSIASDINRILNRSLEVPINIPDTLPFDPLKYTLEDLYLQIKKRSPELKVQKRGLEQSKENIQLSKMDYYPDVEVLAEGLRDVKLELDGYQVFVKASFPLYFWDKQNKAVSEHVSRYHANIESFQKEYQSLAFRVKDAYLITKRAAELIHMFQDSVIPQAKSTLASSDIAYTSSAVDFITYLHNLLTLQDDEIELEGEITEHAIALADISEVIGIIL